MTRPGRGGKICCLAAAVAMLVSPSVGSVGPQGLTPADRLRIFDDVWTDVRHSYYDPSLHGLDWDAVRARHRPDAERAPTDRDFYRAVNEMLEELHDAHTAFFAAADANSRSRRRSTTLGLVVDTIDNHMAVTYVWPHSVAADAAVVPGMVLKAIDGVAVANLLDQAIRRVPQTSSPQATTRAALDSLLERDPVVPVTLLLERADGTSASVRMTALPLDEPPDVRAAILPSGDLYLRFDGFSHEVMTEVQEMLIGKFRSAPGLLIDLRHNPGGDFRVVSEIAGMIFGARTRIAGVIRRGASVDHPSNDDADAVFSQAYNMNATLVYQAPVVVLTSVESASASELLAAAIQELGRGRVVGQRTCGCVLGVSKPRVIKDGGVLELSDTLPLSARGRVLEGVGVIPDEEVAPSLGDLQHNRDAVFAAGEAALQRLVRAKASRRREGP